jgi:hypothetical protein
LKKKARQICYLFGERQPRGVDRRSVSKRVMVITANERRWVTDTLTCPELLPGFAVNVQDIFAWPAAPANAVE